MRLYAMVAYIPERHDRKYTDYFSEDRGKRSGT